MRVHSVRKLFLFGRYSLALLLPKRWLSDLGVKRGDSVELQLDRARQRIVLRFSSVVPSKATDEAPDKKQETKSDSQSELQPIPEL